MTSIRTHLALVYTSRADEIFKLRVERHKLKFHAQAENTKHGITGMLVYSDGFFIQVLEGEINAVETLFQAIAKDPRHSNVNILYRLESASAIVRTYTGWAMGYMEHDTSALQQCNAERQAALEKLVEFARVQQVSAAQFIEVFIDPAKSEFLATENA